MRVCLCVCLCVCGLAEKLVLFMKEHACDFSSFSPPRQDDTPLRAMKTILSQLAKVMGAAVLSHLGLVGGGPTDSTVGAYLTLKLSKDGIDPDTASGV